MVGKLRKEAVADGVKARRADKKTRLRERESYCEVTYDVRTDVKMQNRKDTRPHYSATIHSSDDAAAVRVPCSLLFVRDCSLRIREQHLARRRSILWHNVAKPKKH